jgi:4-hydroxy-3-polyprenylbenzoate decarboxylase
LAAYIVALTGASGAIYGISLVRELLTRGDDVDLVISPSGFLIIEDELGLRFKKGEDAGEAVCEYIKKSGRKVGAGQGSLGYTPYDELTSPLASGSALKKVMVICPCSMGTLSRVASGTSANLIERAADCVLKEKGRLVLVPRETPLSAIHLENMLKLSRLGVTILPAMPAFYHHPKTLEEMVDFVVGKVLDSLGIENELYRRWKGKGS